MQSVQIINNTNHIITIAARKPGAGKLGEKDARRPSDNVVKVRLVPGISEVSENDYNIIKELKYVDDLVSIGHITVAGRAASKSQIDKLVEEIEFEKAKSKAMEAKLKDAENSSSKKDKKHSKESVAIVE